MPAMQFGISSFQRARGDLPELPVINMFAEAGDSESVSLQSRPGLDQYVTMGSGPIRQIFSGDGVLDDGFYGVSGNDLYAGTTLLGTIDGAGPVSMAGYSNLLFAAAGGGLWSWDMTNLVNVSFPDGADVRKVITGASRAICIREDTEQFYWSDPLTSTVGGLSFATAESQPDRLRDMAFIDDTLVLGGAESIEFWPSTGDDTLPFQPLEGRVFESGIKATGCMTKFTDTFAWVSNQQQVCVGDPKNIISHPGLEALIGLTDTPRLWTYWIDGTEFLALRIDAGSWAYSARTGKWYENASDGLTNWQAQCHARGFFGSATDGKIWRWGADNLDNDGVMERRFRAGLPINSGSLVVNMISLRSNPGRTQYLVGDYASPVVEMRLSRNAGKTWGSWKPASLGDQGDYRREVKWVGLGMFGQPGVLAEFRLAQDAPIDWRVSGVYVNEPLGGF